MDELLSDLNQIDIDRTALLVNLLVCIICSITVRFYYFRFSTSLSGRHHVANMLPLLACTTFLVITVVKSSLALSLGLVGALSIIRFRTPIKEPEELAFIFMSIAIGIGLGANQALTTVTVLIVLLLLDYYRVHGRSANYKEYNLVLDLSGDGNSLELAKLIDFLQKRVSPLKLDKLEADEHRTQLIVRLPLESVADGQKLVADIQAVSPAANCTIFDAKPMW